MRSFASHWVMALQLAAMVLGVLALGTSVSAQTNPSILVMPWQDEPHWAETFDQPLILNGGHLKGEPGSIRIVHYDSFGRIKLDRENADPRFFLGYRILTIDVDSGVKRLPSGLTDIALVGGYRVGEIGDDWKLSVLAGGGTANDNHFSNSDALYGIGAVNLSKDLDERSRLDVGVSYHGNRSIFPDIPLPYASYTTRVSDELSLTLGLPVSSVQWRIAQPVSVEVRYAVPNSFTGRVSLHLSEDVSLFAEYDRKFDGFHRHNLSGDRRLFYEMNAVGAGVRFKLGNLADVSVGGGYAFDQSMKTGWDVRDLDTVAEPSDEPYLFLTVRGTF